MRTKPADTLYCNVNQEKIKSAQPTLNKENLKNLRDWIVERYSIHIKKDIQKLESPWTENPILLKYRFTNVRREQDKETRWLIKNVCNSDKINYENKILNIILFRLFNKSQTHEVFGILDFGKIDFKKIKHEIEKRMIKNPNYVFFSNAFYTSGPKGAANKIFPKETQMPIKIIKLVNHYKEQKIIDKIKSAKSQLDVYNTLKSCKGIGQFLAYQIFVDLTYIAEFPFSENEFVMAGPGCKNGMNMLFEDFSGLNYEEALFWLRDNQENIFKGLNYEPNKIFTDLSKEERYLNLMCIQGCMCELSKYVRAINGEGRPRILYKTSKDNYLPYT